MSNDIKLTASQQRVFDQLRDFVNSKDQIFILKGYAGTGKTTMMRFLVQWLDEQNKGFRLLAPTGRAAKILRDKVFVSPATPAGNAQDTDEAEDFAAGASTIHSMLYRFKDFNQDVTDIKTEKDANGQLCLVFAPAKVEPDKNYKGCIYIIDEASMVSDQQGSQPVQAVFGSGRTLTELLAYDKHPYSKFVFVGDPCQLPPIGSITSPALSVPSLTAAGYKCREANLTEIIRQSESNSIVRSAAVIRKMKEMAPPDVSYYPAMSKVWTKLPFRGSTNIILHPSLSDMVAHYLHDIRNRDYSKATFICRGNRSCDSTALSVRQQLGFNPNSVVEKNDLLLVIQNNLISGLVNGDMVEVQEVAWDGMIERARLHFVPVSVREQVSGKTISQLMIVETITQSNPNLTPDQQTALFVDFIIRMKHQGIKPKTELFKHALMNDVYLNALRCVYGYALTCHKAQGGEWEEVYLDMPRNITLNPTQSSYQWVYTAMTRAKTHLHVVEDFFIS